LGLNLSGDLEQREERNFLGILAGDIVVTRRTDSRTYFVHDKRFGATRSAGTFEGRDEELIQRGRTVVERLGVELDEVDAASVIQVMGAVAELDRSTGEIRSESPERGERYVELSRRVDGIRVFSSRLLLALDRQSEVGFLELHWPELSSEVMGEARRLQALVERGFAPPEIEGARVESVEAGIVHSPAIAFVMDVKPVIRVVYAPLDDSHGKKPVRYLDAARRDVSAPRTFETMTVPKEGRRTESTP
jgi:hypothetical protein